MKSLFTAAAIAAATVFTPVASFAQFAVDTPVGGVRIGEPSYRQHSRDYDRPVVRERRSYRERNERNVGMNCRTVTIERDDGSMRRVRRCD